MIWSNIIDMRVDECTRKGAQRQHCVLHCPALCRREERKCAFPGQTEFTKGRDVTLDAHICISYIINHIWRSSLPTPKQFPESWKLFYKTQESWQICLQCPSNLTTFPRKTRNDDNISLSMHTQQWSQTVIYFTPLTQNDMDHVQTK